MMGEEVHPGITEVPDPLLDRLHALFPPLKKIPARVEYLDIVGLAASQRRSGFKRSLINHLQGSNMLAAVIGTFQSGDASTDKLANDALSELNDLEAELLLSDLMAAENRLKRIEQAKKKPKQELDPLEEQTLRVVMENIGKETPLRQIEFESEQKRKIRSFGFLSQKPLLVIVNRGEEQDGETLADALEDRVTGPGRRLEVVDAKLEAEIAVLEPADRDNFLSELGIESPASERVIRTGFELIGLIRFFTIGDDEVRAWAIPGGTTAIDAAGGIHTDLQRGFIKAEVVQAEDLIEAGSLSACRDKGLLRLESKDYTVADGDMIYVRFNV